MHHTFVRRSAVALLAAASLAAATVPAPARAQDAQPATVTGRVTGENGGPLPRVQGYIPPLTLGGITRDDGRYTILVPPPPATRQTGTLPTPPVGPRAARPGGGRGPPSAGWGGRGGRRSCSGRRRG